MTEQTAEWKSCRCGALLTVEYYEQHDGQCKSCYDDLGYKLYKALS